MMNEKTPLTVYKASAGSGKTFTLATEYIKLLLSNESNYRSILAVTFTNKATEEMKHRILSQLYGIWKGLPDSANYIKKVCSELELSERQAAERAGKALTYLLHNYSYFRVETIDSFFQSVLRNLARELDLTPNLSVWLDDKQVEDMAVDELINELDSNHEVLHWILRYVNDHISEDKGWNVIDKIKTFGKTIFADFYRENSKYLSEKVADKHFFDKFTRRLKTDTAEAQEIMSAIAYEFFTILAEESLDVPDFSNGKGGVCGFFIKLRDGDFTPDIVGSRIQTAANDTEAWVAKSNKRRDVILDVVRRRLHPLLQRGIVERERQWSRYQSARLTLAHLYELRLLGNIEKKVHELNEEHNRFLLSDTQHLLHSLISDSDSPFIFEKIGSRLEHVMIDEFQDTGTTQWQNFKVLLRECMSHEGSQNLIVGDVKQSIYRWRSGDWQILNNIEHRFGGANGSDRMISVCNLDTNYRSSRNVIDFNNAFFAQAVKIEAGLLDELNEGSAEQLRMAYADVGQKVPDGRPSDGYVRMTLLPPADYEEEMLAEVGSIIHELQGRGVASSQMAIIVRDNKAINLIAEYLSVEMPDVKVVSDEAFRLDASPAVNMIMCALRLVVHPNDTITKATLVSLYREEVEHNPVPFDNEYLSGKSLDEMLPESFLSVIKGVSHGHCSLSLVEAIYRSLGLNAIPGQTAYLCAFYDKLSKYSNEVVPTIRGFIEEWDDRLHKTAIQDTETDGIRIVTIHKSKGLEFSHVIIPFCDWQLERSGNIIWCQSDVAPYNELPFIPVDFSRSALMGTVFERDYLEEHLQNVVDNLNLLYVAFTRAKDSLYVIGKRKKPSSGRKTSASPSFSTRSAVIEASMPLLAGVLTDAVLTGETDAPLVLEYGEHAVNTGMVKERRPLQNVFSQPSTPLPVSIGVFKDKYEFRQSNASEDFIEGSGEADDSTNYIKVGSILHNVFSSIRTVDDIDTSLAQLQMQGVLSDDASVDRIQTMLHKRLTNPRVADWFSSRWTLFNECSILSYDNAEGTLTERRPDRVMTDGGETIVVDFKFGNSRPEYHEQLHEYMSLLSTMGYPDVHGYLWYVYSNKIEEV